MTQGDGKMISVKLTMAVWYWLIHTLLICLGFIGIMYELRKIRKELEK